MYFGLIGGLMAAADMAAKSGRLTSALDPSQTRLQGRFAEEIAPRLQAAGHAVTTLPVADKATDADMIDTVRRSAPADAILQIRLNGTDMAGGTSTPYVPNIAVAARLVDVRSGATLFEDTFTYGSPAVASHATHTASHTRFQFETIDALVVEPAVARQGPIDGLPAIAAQIVGSLKRQ